jgi:predicted dehydrogenase
MVIDEMVRVRGENAAAVPFTLPESVSVECFREGGIDVQFSALLKYADGVIASIHCGFNAQKQIEAQIVGTKGVLNIPGVFLGDAGTLTISAEGAVQRTIAVEASDRYRLQVEDFAEALRARGEPRLGMVESLRNMKVLDWLRAASRFNASRNA